VLKLPGKIVDTGNMAGSKDPLDLLPGLKKTIELGREFDKQQCEADERKNFATNVRDSILANLQQQHINEVARQEEGNAEVKKQTTLAELALEEARQSRQIAEHSQITTRRTFWLAFVGIIISAVALGFSIWSIFCKEEGGRLEGECLIEDNAAKSAVPSANDAIITDTHAIE
jgi:hypothetical protein